MKKFKSQPSEITLSQSFIYSKSGTKIACSEGNDAINVCSSKICEKYAFVCPDKNCQCRKQHDDCLKTDIEGLISNIKRDFRLIKPLQQKINEIFGLFRKNLEKQQSKLLGEIQQLNLKRKQSQKEQSFIQKLESGKCRQITGKFVWEIQSQIFKESDKSKIVEEIILRWEEDQKDFQTKITKLCEKISNCIQNLKFGIQDQKALFFSSNLLKQPEHVQTMSKFFNRKIQKTILLYRASQNAFSLLKFYQKCSYRNHTITISRTENNKVIGGYTPLEWFKTPKCEQVPDQSGDSFLFSLTNKHKFILQNKKYAINRASNNSYGPAFGNGWDFFIRDNAKLNNHSGGRINTSYVNENYTPENKQQHFLGTSKGICNCKFKQWEVWQIVFASD